MAQRILLISVSYVDLISLYISKDVQLAWVVVAANIHKGANNERYHKFV